MSELTPLQAVVRDLREVERRAEQAEADLKVAESERLAWEKHGQEETFAREQAEAELKTLKVIAQDHIEQVEAERNELRDAAQAVIVAWHSKGLADNPDVLMALGLAIGESLVPLEGTQP